MRSLSGISLEYRLSRPQALFFFVTLFWTPPSPQCNLELHRQAAQCHWRKCLLPLPFFSFICQRSFFFLFVCVIFMEIQKETEKSFACIYRSLLFHISVSSNTNTKLFLILSTPYILVHVYVRYLLIFHMWELHSNIWIGW